MKILGISCGSAMGNSEIMLRAALMRAEEKGADVSLIRINDFYIAPCTNCGKCEKENADYVHDCIFEDDFPLLAKSLLDSDGLIVSFPVYNWSPAGQLKVLADRFGSHYNRAAAKERKAKGLYADDRLLKKRPVGFISVAGAMDAHYYSMGMGPVRQFTYDLGLATVDQVLCGFTTDKGHCLKHDDKMKHAKKIGENVVKALLTGDFSWKGDAGTCPVCHNNMMILKDGKIRCPFCDISGDISYDGSVHTDFRKADLSQAASEEERMLSVLHRTLDEITAFEKRRSALADKLSYYRQLDIPVVGIEGGYPKKEGAE